MYRISHALFSEIIHKVNVIKNYHRPCIGVYAMYEMQLYPSSVITMHLVVSEMIVAMSNAMIVWC